MNNNQSAWIFLISLLLASCDVSWSDEERRHVRVDGAMTLQYPRGLYVFLYAGDRYLLLDSDGKEVETSHFDKEELGMDPQALFSVSSIDDRKIMFFGKDYSLKLWIYTNEKEILEYGPNRKFLQKGGPDAAAKKGGKVYFFKGCKMAGRRTRPYKWEKPERVQSRGLPCNVDAAWSGSDGNSIVILKGNEIWLWKADDTVEGPTLFHDAYDVTSWILDPVE